MKFSKSKFQLTTKTIQIEQEIFYRNDDYQDDGANYQQITKVMELFYELALLDGETLIPDNCLLREWHWFVKIVILFLNYAHQVNVKI